MNYTVHTAINKLTALIFKAMACFAFMALTTVSAFSQDCDPNVPHFVADLSDDPAGVFLTPFIQRDGNCCGTTHPDKCVSFSITLHEDAVGILFDVCEGAMPPGSLFYQIDCGPEISVGNVLCLDGPGPHHLTFCKPGNNQNVYCITSIPPPGVGPNQIASDGCTADIWAIGYNPATIQWTSVYPGPQGAFNNLLNCTNCETATVTAPEDFPPYVDFMACGSTIGSCATTPYCDTVRVHFASTLAVEIAPEEPAICFGSTGTEVTAVGSGGYPPYIFTWSNGETGENVWIEEPGDYTVTVTDTSGCPPASFTFTVTEYAEPLTVDAGGEIVVCDETEDIQLNGIYTGIDQAEWMGGNGTFLPNEFAANATYVPTPEEIEQGHVELVLALIPLGSCPPAYDTLHIFFAPFEAEISIQFEHIQCHGASDGSTTISVTGDWEPYNVEWSHTDNNNWELTGLAPGTYSAMVNNSLGCGQEIEFTLTEPALLEANPEIVSNVSCHGSADGSVVFQVAGGTEPYDYTWSNGQNSAESETLSAGNYTVLITDDNGCSTEVQFEITEPTPVELDAYADTLVCIGSEVTLTAQATGGSGEFNYFWNPPAGQTGTIQVVANENTVYSVYAVDANNCFTDTILLPIAVISMDEDLLQTIAGDPVCMGGETSVEAHYTGEFPPYTYTWSHNLPDGQGPHIVSPDESTTYTVIVSDICNNIVSGEVTVTIWPLPQLQLVETSDVSCFGLDDGSATVSASGGTPTYAFHWTGFEFNSSMVNGLPPGSHSVIVSDSNQCPDSLVFSISEPNPLSLSATSDTLVCPNEIFTLEAIVTGGLGEYTYHWSNELPNSSTHEVSVTQNTTFEVYVTDANNCPTPAEILPVQVITMHPGLLSVWNTGNICPGQTSNVNAIYQGEYPPYTYTWIAPVANGPGPHTVQPDETTTYSLEVSDECDNSLTGNTTVVVHPLPEINLPSMLAEGCADLLVYYEDTFNSPGNHSFTWSVNQSEFYTGHVFEYTFSTPGLHEVELTVTSFYGCQASTDQPSFVIVRPGVTANFIASPWEAGIDHPIVQFTDLSFENIQEWQWSFGDGAESNQQHPEHMYPDTGNYVVQLVVTNQFDCADNISRIVRIKPVYDIIIPNAFTPTSNGGNGYYDPSATNNDIFYPFADYVEEFRMSIFNRWGELIFESLDINYGWNGTYRGEPCPQDVYVYKVEFVFSDGVDITRVGDITLFR